VIASDKEVMFLLLCVSVCQQDNITIYILDLKRFEKAEVT